jgi:hypothetical protein
MEPTPGDLVIMDAAQFDRLIQDSGMSEYLRKAFMKAAGVTDLSHIPRGHFISYRFDASTLRIGYFGAYE